MSNPATRKLFWYKQDRAFLDLSEVVAVRPIVTGIIIKLRQGARIQMLNLGDDIERFYAAFGKKTE